VWTDEQKEFLANCIYEKGLVPGYACYFGNWPENNAAKWIHNGSNWSLVCSGGMVMGAVAVFEKHLFRLACAVDSIAEHGGDPHNVKLPFHGGVQGNSVINIVSDIHIDEYFSFSGHDNLPSFSIRGFPFHCSTGNRQSQRKMGKSPCKTPAVLV
jgi:hypothetical protein